jgi:hypothetical protein
LAGVVLALGGGVVVVGGGVVVVGGGVVEVGGGGVGAWATVVVVVAGVLATVVVVTEPGPLFPPPVPQRCWGCGEADAATTLKLMTETPEMTARTAIPLRLSW